jgi:hypothetical protein
MKGGSATILTAFECCVVSYVGGNGKAKVSNTYWRGGWGELKIPHTIRK